MGRSRVTSRQRSDIDPFADVDYGRFDFVPFMDLREDLAKWFQAEGPVPEAVVIEILGAAA